MKYVLKPMSDGRWAIYPPGSTMPIIVAPTPAKAMDQFNDRGN